MMLKDEFGLIGYAVYWKTLEVCAGNWDRISNPKFSFPARKLKRKCGVSVRKLEEIYQFCNKNGLLFFKKDSKSFCFYVPKLLKIADNYTKNLPVADKKLKPHIDKEKENINKALITAPDWLK